MILSRNKYEIKDRLGGGSFGEVFRVRHKHLDREEAVKIIKTNKFNRTFRTNYRPDISKRLIKIINRALNINPLKRYQSAKEMLIEIEYQLRPI